MSCGMVCGNQHSNELVISPAIPTFERFLSSLGQWQCRKPIVAIRCLAKGQGSFQVNVRKSNDCWIRLLQVGNLSSIMGRCSSIFLPPGEWEVISIWRGDGWFLSIILVPRPVTEELVRKRWEGGRIATQTFGVARVIGTLVSRISLMSNDLSSQSKSLVPSIINKKIDLVAKMMTWVQWYWLTKSPPWCLGIL